MKKFTGYFTHDYENDTTVEYVNAGSYTMLNCSFTSEDPDFGTETLNYKMLGDVPRERIAYRLLCQIESYLDFRAGKIYTDKPAAYYSEYSNSTLIAIENALRKISASYISTRWFMKVNDAAEMIAKALVEDRNKRFAYCMASEEEAQGDPEDFKDDGGWYGIRRIPGFFDNEEEEFIVAAGHFGGGGVGFGYADVSASGDDYYRAVLSAMISPHSEFTNYSMINIEIDNDSNENKEEK